MARIKERKGKSGKVRYTAEIRLKGHPPASATFDRKTDAKAWIQETETAIRDGRYFKTAESDKRTLSELIERFQDAELYRRRVDAAKVKMHLEWWDKRLGPYTLADITHIRISELKDAIRNEETHIGDERSNATINRYLASLSICFSYGVKDLGWLDENPVLKVRKEKEGQGRLRFLSPEERDNLLEAAAADVSKNIHPIIVLGLCTGMRSSEITTLQWNNFDKDRRRIILEKTKNRERRSIPLANVAFDILKKRNKVRRLGNDYIFTNQDGITPYRLRKAWLRVLKKAKLNEADLRFHDLRHTAASYLAMNGATLLEIAEILGHKTLAMVKRYSHLTEGHTAKVIERMAEAQFTTSQKDKEKTG